MKHNVRVALLAAGAVGTIGLVAGVWMLRSATRADPAAASLAGLASVPLETPRGMATTLGALAPAGRPTVVTFWASWCVPCVAETKALVAVRAHYAAADLAIVAINVDSLPRDASRMALFLDRAGARTLSQTLGTQASYRAITGHSTMMLPRGFIFDRTGASIRSLAGYKPELTDNEIATAVRIAVGR